MLYLEPAAGTTFPVPFDTFAAAGGSLTMTGLAVTDIEIYKDSSMTQRASDNGYTLLDTDGIDLDSITGIHGLTINLSDNSDSGFYAVGSWYRVVVSTITVDGQTISFTACMFRIRPTEHTAGYPVSTVKPGTGTGEIDLSSGKLAWNSAWDAEVESEVADGLVAIHLDHLFAVADPTGAVANNSFWAKLHSKSATATYTSYAHTTDSMEATADTKATASALSSVAFTVSEIESAVYDSVFGLEEIRIQLNASQVYIADTNFVSNETYAIVGGLPSAEGVASAVWQDTTSGDFTVTSSIGRALYIAAIPGAAGGHMIAGSNAGTTTFGALTVTGAFTAGTNALPWPAAWDAEVQSEVQDAIEVNHLDHWIAVADPGGIVANDSFLAKQASTSNPAVYSSYNNTTDSSEALRDTFFVLLTNGTYGLSALATSILTRLATAGYIAPDNVSAAAANAKLNENFEAFFAQNTENRSVDDLTTPKNIVVNN